MSHENSKIDIIKVCQVSQLAITFRRILIYENVNIKSYSQKMRVTCCFLFHASRKEKKLHS